LYGSGINPWFIMLRSLNEECVPKHKVLVTDMGLIQQKEGIRSLSQEYVYGSSSRNRHVRNTKAWLEIRQWKKSGNTWT